MPELIIGLVALGVISMSVIVSTTKCIFVILDSIRFERRVKVFLDTTKDKNERRKQ